MPGVKKEKLDKIYLSIVYKTGELVHKVDKGTEDARSREWSLPNGNVGVSYEVVYRSWEGVIQDVTFKDGEYGRNCVIELDDAFISLPVDGRYFMDFAKRVFSGNLKEAFIFKPYSFTSDDGQVVKGISLQQNGEKLGNYFYDPINKKNINNFPEIDTKKLEKMDKKYWPIYFAEVAIFLQEEIEKLQFEPRKTIVEEVEVEDKTLITNEEEYADDLPF